MNSPVATEFPAARLLRNPRNRGFVDNLTSRLWIETLLFAKLSNLSRWVAYQGNEFPVHVWKSL